MDAFDDFDDFQSAPVAPAPNPVPSFQTQAIKPMAPMGGANVFDFLNATQPTQSPTVASPMVPPAMSRPSYSGSSMGVGGGMGNTPLMPATTMTPSLYNNTSLGGRATPTQAQGRATPTAKSSNFNDLWSTSLTSLTGRPAGPVGGGMGGATGGKSIMDLQKEKAQATFWGASTQGQGQKGNMDGAGTMGSSAGGGLDDLIV